MHAPGRHLHPDVPRNQIDPWRHLCCRVAVPRQLPLMISSALARMAAVLGILIGFPGNVASAWEPLRAHPQNPYILEFRGQPALLRTFGPRYEWIFDSSHDFIPYLDVFQRDGMNLTRVWCLGYPASPAANFNQPWQRATTGANALDGLRKWDFNTWNEAYFTRLKAFAQAASDRGIAVEFTLFSVFYNDTEWTKSPFHPSNNVQGYGAPNNRYDCFRENVANASLLAEQKKAVRRIVRELNGFDNVYFEIQNEPFWNEPNINDTEEVAFHNSMLAAIREEQATLPNRHMVAHNFPQRMTTLSSDFDIFNEHYPAVVPTTTIAGAEALLANHYSRGRILSLDETDTVNEPQTRLEAWMFFIGGGGIYDGLDYQGVAYTEAVPSGDTTLGNSIRGTVRNSWTYMNRLHLVALRRNLAWVTGGIPNGAKLQASASPGQQYVAYLHHGQSGIENFQLRYNPIDSSQHNVSLNVTLPAGTWRAVWTRPADLVELQVQEFTHAGGAVTLNPVAYLADVALRIDRTGAGDTTPPPIPAGLAAVANPDGSVSLSWNPVQASDLGGYRVYRSEIPGVPTDSAHRIAVMPVSLTEFRDASATFGMTYYYGVTAVDLIGNESSAGSEITTTSSLTYPNLNASEPSGGQVTLEWATDSPGYYLQENTSLSPDSWTYSSLIPIMVGGNYQVTVTLTPQRRFFRLTHEPPTPPEIHFFNNDQGGFFLQWTTALQGWGLAGKPGDLSGLLELLTPRPDRRR